MGKIRIALTDFYILAIYELINTVFVYKYTSRITSYSWATSLIYLIIVNFFILLLFKKYEARYSLKIQNIIYFSMITGLSILFFLVMINFDPQNIRVGRYPALHDWITRLFNFIFPYTSGTKPSGFPFLFVLAMPFYLLGDLGIFQIFSFLLYAIIIHLRHQHNSINRFRSILLLTVAPLFLYEVVVRSDLFSNITIVMFYLAIYELNSRRAGHIALFVLGIIGGLLLSTRGIVLPIYITFFSYFLKKRILNASLFLPAMFVGFSLTILPFLIWNWEYFIRFGPFSIQLSYIPGWLLILSIVFCIWCGLTIKSLKRIYSSISFILFGIIFAAFVISIFKYGWHTSVLGDRFDISYFGFTLPFLVIALNFSEKEKTPPDSMFVTTTASG